MMARFTITARTLNPKLQPLNPQSPLCFIPLPSPLPLQLWVACADQQVVNQVGQEARYTAFASSQFVKETMESNYSQVLQAFSVKGMCLPFGPAPDYLIQDSTACPTLTLTLDQLAQVRGRRVGVRAVLVAGID